MKEKKEEYFCQMLEAALNMYGLDGFYWRRDWR